MDKLDVLRQQLVEAKFKDGVCVSAAHLHDPQRFFFRVVQQRGAGFQAIDKLQHLLRRAIFINVTHVLSLLAIQQGAHVRLDVKHIL